MFLSLDLRCNTCKLMNSKAKAFKSLPPNMLKYFWDCKKEELDLEVYKPYILDRLMQYGDLEAITWILKNIDCKDVLSCLERRGKHSLDRKSYLFWKKLCGEPGIWG